MAFKTSEKYKSVIYSGDCRHKLKLLFNGVELEDADVYCESLKVTSRILPNGSTRFSLDNFIAKEAELILHDIDTTKIQSPVNISIGTLVDGTYEYVPIGLFVVQDLPTTDKNKTTIKLRDYAVKFDFGYNAKDIIDENGGSVTKLQILKDICNKAGVETDITKFYGSNSKIGIYDNTITGRTYISYLAEQAGAIATIDRSGKLIFVQLKGLETVEIPLNIVEKYEDGEKYEISRVVYEDAIRKFEYGDESKDTLFINTANPYIDDEVLTNTLTGTQIETSDSTDAEVVGYKQNGIRKQNVYSGKNKNVNAENVIASASSPANSFTNLAEYDGYKNVVEVSTNISYMTLRTNEVSNDLTEKIATGGIDITSMLLIKKTNANTAIKLYLGDITGGAIYNELKHYKDEANGWAWYYTTHTIPANPSIKTIRHHLSATNVGTFYVAKIQTLIGSTPGDFEPYVGGKASPSPDYPQEIEVATGSVSAKSTGKSITNLVPITASEFYHKNYCETQYIFDEELNKEILYVKTTGAYPTVAYKLPKRLEKGKHYVLKFKYKLFVETTNNDNYKAAWILPNASGNMWDNTAFVAGKTTAPASVWTDKVIKFDINESRYDAQATSYSYILLSLGYGLSSATTLKDFYISDLMLYEISEEEYNDGNYQAIDYEPYKESSIQHHLGDNFLADKDYIQDGVLNKNIGKIVLNGSENWLENSASKGLFQITLSNVYYNNTTINALSDKLIGTTGTIITTSNYYINNSVATYSNNRLFFRFDEFAENLDGLKAWLKENPVTVYYELATPEQIPLETTGELRTFEPNTIITNDLNSEMEVEYSLNQTQVSQILELNKNIPLNSFKTGKIIGNPAIDAYDIIKIVDDDKEFKTLATNDLTYNGVMINSFDTQIGKEAKKENVTLTPEATFKKWAKTEIDNVEASVKITTGKIEEAVLNLETDVNNNSVNINNNYQEIIGKFEGYTPTSQTIQLEQSVTQLQTDTYTKTEINTKLTDGSVTKVRTTSGTFDEDGMHYEKTGAPTKSTINEAGVSVDSSSSGEELLFAGYDEDINQTIVRTENLTVRRYLVVGENTRIEDYTDEEGNVGGGLFIL